MRIKWNIESAKKQFSDRGCVLLESEYKNYSTPMRYVATCGHEHKITMNNFLQGKGNLCSVCRRNDNHKKESKGDQYYRDIFNLAGCVVLTDNIQTNKTTVSYVALCGHKNEIQASHFQMGGGRLCRKCSHSIRYEYDYVKEMFEQKDCVLLESSYINCKTPMRYVARCGHESSISFDVFLNSSSATLRCRDCHKHSYNDVPIDRNRTASKTWRRLVYEKDAYTCSVCGKHGGELNAHHLLSYDNNPKDRFDISNGITLCPRCHILFHASYGFGNNTPEQFYDWLREYRGNSSPNTDEHRNA